MKKVVCLLLSLCLCAALCVPALADAFKEDFQEELTEEEILEKLPKYVSWIRDGSADELNINSPFKSTIEGYLDYLYVSRDTSWTITHTGGDDYKIFLYVTVLDAENHQYYSDTTYSLCEDGVFRSMGEQRLKRVMKAVSWIQETASMSIVLQLISQSTHPESTNP